MEYDDPNDINELGALKIQTVSGNLLPEIFANGNNQMPVEITVRALNKNRQALKFSGSTWFQILNLRFAESDRKLAKAGNSGWCFTDTQNDYSIEILRHSDFKRSLELIPGDRGSYIIIMYVYTNEIGTKRIAVSVDTENGKHFTTADNSSGAEKMSVKIKAKPAIDYSDKRNLSVFNGGFVMTSNNLGWTSRLSSTGPYTEYFNGTCKRRIVSIQPNELTTGLQKFKAFSVKYKPILNEDVNQGTINWDSEPPEDCFSLMRPIVGLPCAVIGRGYSYNEYQLNIWYSRQNDVEIKGQVYLADNLYYYRFSPYVVEKHIGDNEKEQVTLMLYKFTLPLKGSSQYNWHDVVHVPTVTVIDMYGNEGTFELTFDDGEHFDTPGFV